MDEDELDNKGDDMGKVNDMKKLNEFDLDKEENENEVEVEKILDKRVMNGKIEYLVKWKNGNESDWVEEGEMIDCEKLLEEFYQKPKKKKKKKLSGVQRKKQPGLQFGDKIEKVIGAKMVGNNLHLYVKWEGKDNCSLIPAKDCHKAAPQQVISFYESRIVVREEK